MYIYVEEECSAPSCTLANEAINNVDSVVYGGDDGARTRDLCRDSPPLSGFSTTYNYREGYPSTRKITQDRAFCGTDCGTAVFYSCAIPVVLTLAMFSGDVLSCSTRSLSPAVVPDA
jgi:hypothetical protein